MTSIPTLYVPPILTACQSARLALIPSGDIASLSRGPYQVLVIPTPGTQLESISTPINAQTALERIANLNPNSLTDWRVDIPAGVAVSFAVIDEDGQQIQVNSDATGNARMIQGSDSSCIGQNSGANEDAFRTLLLMASSLSAAGSTIALPSSIYNPVQPTSSSVSNNAMHLSAGCIAGIVVGCVLVLLAILLSAIFFVSRRNKRQRDLEAAQSKDAKVETKTVVLPTSQAEKEKEAEAEREWDDKASEITYVS